MILLATSLLSVVQLNLQELNLFLHFRNFSLIGLVQLIITNLRELGSGSVIGAVEMETLFENPLIKASIRVLEFSSQVLIVLF